MGKIIKKLRELSPEEMQQQLEQAKKDLFKQRFEIVTGHVTNVKLLKNAKRKIARIYTLQTQATLKAAK